MVTCVREGLINNLIEAAFVNHPQQRNISIPTPLQVSGRTVVIAGDFRLLPPVVTLSGGRVGMLVRAQLEARVSGGTTEPLDVLVELRSAVDVGLTTFVTGNQLQVGVDPATVTISSLSLTVLDGSLPSIYGETLRMPEVAAAVQTAVRALPQSMLSTTVDGFPVTTHVAPRQMPWGRPSSSCRRCSTRSSRSAASSRWSSSTSWSSGWTSRESPPATRRRCGPSSATSVPSGSGRVAPRASSTSGAEGCASTATSP